MVNTNKIKGLLAENGMNQTDLATILKLNRRTVFDKMQSGVFKTSECETMIELFHLTDPVDIVKVFFPDALRNTQHEGR